MATVLTVGGGSRIFLVEFPGSRSSAVAWASDPERAARRRADLRAEDVPDELFQRLAELAPDIRVAVVGPTLALRVQARAHRAVETPDLAMLRAARALLPLPAPGAERAFVRAVAHRSLEQALRSPQEVLITLAREEERVERARGREERAAEAFLAVPDSPLDGYRTAWEAARNSLAHHHARLLATLEVEARAVLPNLSMLVGPRVAARLLSAAGSLAALGRMGAPRLQLLGSRRRPSPERGPRYGLLYRADRMADVPRARRGAYARSLAALGAIAVRADAYTRRDLSHVLLARRDRRVDELRRRDG